MIRSTTILFIAVIAILTLPAMAEIDGKIEKVDWAMAAISACPPIDYKPTVTITNTGDEKARFYVTISVMDQKGKERRSGCWPTQEIEPEESTTVWPYAVKLTGRYNRVKVSLYANSCLETHLLDTDRHMVELKDCSSKHVTK